MTTPLKCLIVEDSADDAELIVRELRRAGYAPEWTVVQTEPDFLAALKQLPDIILSDYSMPQFNGVRAVELSLASGLNIPCILISGTVGEDVAIEALRRGATDYLLKDRITRLGMAVKNALDQKLLRAERKQADAEIQKQLQELQRWHEAMLGRETRIMELKREVNELLVQLHRPPRYANNASS